jgi:transformation/transcription domain-associated protein
MPTFRYDCGLARQIKSQVLQSFQSFVEIQEASHIYLGISPTNAQNKMQSIQELKGTLGTWRDRLPNLWDDIDVWSELVAWRQHVFSVINKAYQPTPEQQNGGGNSLAFRGYHEIAWIVNRFAHVTRKVRLSFRLSSRPAPSD